MSFLFQRWDMDSFPGGYIYLEPNWPLFLKVNPPKQGRNSNQNKGPHLGSRYICYSLSIYIYILNMFKLPDSNALIRSGDLEWIRNPAAPWMFKNRCDFQTWGEFAGHRRWLYKTVNVIYGHNPKDPWNGSVYLPTWMVDFYRINVGKYTSPMDPSWFFASKKHMEFLNFHPSPGFIYFCSYVLVGGFNPSEKY